MAGTPQYPRATAHTSALLDALVDGHLSRTRLAADVGVSAHHLGQILTGRRACPKALADRVAKRLGREVRELFDVEDLPPALQGRVA